MAAGRRRPTSVTVVNSRSRDVDELDDLAAVAGLLGQLAQDGDLGRLAEVEPPPGSVQISPARDRRGDPAEQDPAGLVEAQGVGGDAGPLVAGHGASSAARKRGSSARPAGTRSPITRPIVARTRRAGGDPARRVLEQRGPAEEGLDEPRHGVLGEEPALHRPVVGGEARRRRPRSCAAIAAAASSAETSARWRPFAGERVEEAGGVADQQPARPGAPGHAMAERPGAGDGVASARRGATRRGRRRSAGSAATIESATARAPSPARAPRRHDRPSTIPMLTRPPAPARCRRSRRAGRASGRRGTPSGSRVGEVVGQPDPRVEAGRSGDAGRAGDDRVRPVRADDDRGAERGRAGRRAADARAARSSRSTSVTCQPRRTSAPGAAREVEQRRVEPRPVEPDRRLAAGLGAVGQPEGRPAGGLDAHRRDRPGDRRRASPRPGRPVAGPRPPPAR